MADEDFYFDAGKFPLSARLTRDKYLAQLRAEFMRDSNQFVVWRAYQVMRMERTSSVDPGVSFDETLKLPLWIAAYLDEVAEQLLAGEDPKYALGFDVTGGPTKYEQYGKAERDGWIYNAVASLMELTPDDLPDDPEEAKRFEWLFRERLHGDGKLDVICERVGAHYRLSPKTVRDIYFRHKAQDQGSE